MELEDVYELRAQGKKHKIYSAYFDKDLRVLDAVVEKIEEIGHPQWYPAGFRFSRKQNRKTIYECSLGQIVYEAIKDGNIPSPRGQVRFDDGDPSNLRASNLQMVKGVKVDTVTLAGRKYIRLTYQALGEKKIAITDYDEDLLSVFKSIRWFYETDKRNFCAKGNGRRFLLPVIVLACAGQDVSECNWATLTERYWQMLQEEGNPSIDHKRATGRKSRFGKWDNRRINLQYMPLDLNVAKGLCNWKMPKDCFYIPTADGAEYGRYDKESGTVEVYKQSLDLTKEDIERLKYFCKHGEFAEGTDYITYPTESKEAVEIMMADLQEMKLYAEVAYL